MPVLPPLMIWIAGVVATALAAKLASREYRRVNHELDQIRTPPDTTPVGLQRDRDGVYRPR